MYGPQLGELAFRSWEWKKWVWKGGEASPKNVIWVKPLPPVHFFYLTLWLPRVIGM